MWVKPRQRVASGSPIFVCTLYPQPDHAINYFLDDLEKPLGSLVLALISTLIPTLMYVLQ